MSHTAAYFNRNHISYTEKTGFVRSDKLKKGMVINIIKHDEDGDYGQNITITGTKKNKDNSEMIIEFKYSNYLDVPLYVELNRNLFFVKVL